MTTAKKAAAPKATVAAGDAPSESKAPAALSNPLPARVQPQQYSEEGWAVGNRAPSDMYVEVGQDGQAVGKPSKTPPKGYGSQIAVKGDVVTHATRAALGYTD